MLCDIRNISKNIENGANICENYAKMFPRRAKEGKLSPRWPRMAEARFLQTLLSNFERFGYNFEAEVVTVLVPVSDICSCLFFVSVLEAIDLDFEAHFLVFF